MIEGAIKELTRNLGLNYIGNQAGTDLMEAFLVTFTVLEDAVHDIEGEK